MPKNKDGMGCGAQAGSWGHSAGKKTAKKSSERREYGKSVRRLVKLVQKAFSNPSEFQNCYCQTSFETFESPFAVGHRGIPPTTRQEPT